MFARRRKSGQSYLRRYLDMWAFMGLHPTNFDLLKKLKKAEDQRFAAKMDVCGTVQEFDSHRQQWSESHLVGIRSDVWNPDEQTQSRRLSRLHKERHRQLARQVKPSRKQATKLHQERNASAFRDPILNLTASDLEHRRLILKLFSTTSEQLRWKGTIEEVVTREIQNSLGSERMLLSFAAGLPGYDYLTVLQENHKTFRIPSTFTFCYCDDAHDRIWYFRMRRKWVSIGADFVLQSQGKTVCQIDGALIGLGYNAHIDIYDELLAKDRKFVDLITLFAATIGYQPTMRRSLRRRLAIYQRGVALQSMIEDEELSLLKNPRAA